MGWRCLTSWVEMCDANLAIFVQPSKQKAGKNVSKRQKCVFLLD